MIDLVYDVKPNLLLLEDLMTHEPSLIRRLTLLQYKATQCMRVCGFNLKPDSEVDEYVER
jgi:hypothetical protein